MKNVQLATTSTPNRPRRRMTDEELRFREAQARRAMRRNDKNPEEAPLWLAVLGGLTISGILPAILCPLLFGFGLD